MKTSILFLNEIYFKEEFRSIKTVQNLNSKIGSTFKNQQTVKFRKFVYNSSVIKSNSVANCIVCILYLRAVLEIIWMVHILYFLMCQLFCLAWASNNSWNQLLHNSFCGLRFLNSELLNAMMQVIWELILLGRLQKYHIALFEIKTVEIKVAAA